MNWKRHIIEAITLIGAAVICAFTANAVASRERKVNVAPAAATAPPASSVAPALPASGEQRAASGPPPLAPALPASAENANLSLAPRSGERVAERRVRGREQPAASAAPPITATAAPAPAPKPAVAKKEFKPHPDKAYIEIGYDDVADLHSRGALFLDARRTSVYEQGHITGALPFSVWESDIDQKVNKLFEERGDPREQEKPIVVYCSGGDCEDSHMLAQKLWGIQFNNVYVYKDGFPDWQKRGGAAKTGPTP